MDVHRGVSADELRERIVGAIVTDVREVGGGLELLLAAPAEASGKLSLLSLTATTSVVAELRGA